MTDDDIMQEIQAKMLNVADYLISQLDEKVISDKTFIVAMQAAFNTVSGFLDIDSVKIISGLIKEVTENKKVSQCQL